MPKSSQKKMNSNQAAEILCRLKNTDLTQQRKNKKQCNICKTHQTPQWRKDPLLRDTPLYHQFYLCNADGIKEKKRWEQSADKTDYINERFQLS